MFHKQYGQDHMKEAPLLGALAGAFIGGGSTLAGMLSVGGLVGGAIGAVGGTLLQGAMTPKMPSLDLGPTPQAPQTPAAAQIPGTPSTPAASPTESTVGEATGATPADIAAGEAPKRRKGRVATILTTPRTRLATDEGEEEVERLGG